MLCSYLDSLEHLYLLDWNDRKVKESEAPYKLFNVLTLTSLSFFPYLCN